MSFPSVGLSAAVSEHSNNLNSAPDVELLSSGLDLTTFAANCAEWRYVKFLSNRLKFLNEAKEHLLETCQDFPVAMSPDGDLLRDSRNGAFYRDPCPFEFGFREMSDEPSPEDGYYFMAEIDSHIQRVQTWAKTIFDEANPSSVSDPLVLKDTIRQRFSVEREINKYRQVFTTSVLRERWNFPKHSVFTPASWVSHKMTQKKRGSSYRQRITNALIFAKEQGWYVIFDTGTFDSNFGTGSMVVDDESVECSLWDEYASSPHSFTDRYIRPVRRDVVRSVRRAERSDYDVRFRSRSAEVGDAQALFELGDYKDRHLDDFSDCYFYYAVPEFGGEGGRFHYHILHFMKELPLGRLWHDPCNGLPLSKRVTGSDSLVVKDFDYWPFGKRYPLALRFKGDAWSRRLGWDFPLNKSSLIPEANPLCAVSVYVTKYVTKALDAKVSNRDSKTGEYFDTVSVPYASYCSDFRVRMSRGFGTDLPPMTRLSDSALVELTSLHYEASPFASLIKCHARKEIISRLSEGFTTCDIEPYIPDRPSLFSVLKDLKDDETNLHSLMKEADKLDPDLLPAGKIRQFVEDNYPKIAFGDLSAEVRQWLLSNRLDFLSVARIVRN